MGIGLAAGVASAMQLYSVGAFDPATPATAAAILAVTARLACWSPALRASRLDPLAALRVE